jgi:glycosyltransferase involved in cell wall biosynthesis
VTLAVGLNALHLVPGETGGSELYARRLIAALAAADDPPRLVVFAPDEAAASLAADPWAERVEIVRVPVHARKRARRVLAEQTTLRRAVARARVDLLHNLFTTAPALPGVPQVTTILDVIYKRFPEAHKGVLTQGMRLLVPLAARRSRRVLTLSQAAKDDIVRFLRIPSGRVDVTYLGPALHETDPVPEDELRRRLGLGNEPIVLTVSAKRPHKNLERLFEAFLGVKAEGQPTLVVPGYPTFHEPVLRARAEALGGGARIRFTGWLEDELLDGLYRAASCFVFPSLAEGFGLPVLDALVRGTPTACSNASSLPEVGGDAVLYFDPMDVGEMTRSIERLLADATLRERLRRAGPERARRFTWERTAEATLASYERALARDDRLAAGSALSRRTPGI